MTEIVQVKFECDFCDGCGWYEGGPFLQNNCEKCDGKGYVMIEQEKPIKHKWVIGEWEKRSGDSYLSRTDVCSLCGCEREMVKSFRRGQPKPTSFVATYCRSKQIFGHEHMPECWGEKNPQ